MSHPQSQAPRTPKKAPDARSKGAKQPKKRPSVIQLLSQAKVSSATRELDISYAYDVNPAVVHVLCSCMPNLRKLLIREVGLTSLPKSIGSLVHLRELDISHNLLTALPDTLGQLRELQHLNVSRNTLAALPEALGQMTNLRLLNANYNALTNLPHNLSEMPNLRVLRVGANQLSDLPADVANMADLRLIQLAYNHMATVPTVLWQLEELKVIDLSHNLIAHWPGHIRLPLGLSSLNITGNPLPEAPASLVAAQSHDLTILGLPKGSTRVTQVVTARSKGLPSTHEDDRLSLNATQDLTGILFAGLGDFAMSGEPATSPEGRRDISDDDDTVSGQPKKSV